MGPTIFGNGPRGTSARPQKLSPENAQCAVMLSLINPELFGLVGMQLASRTLQTARGFLGRALDQQLES